MPLSIREISRPSIFKAKLIEHNIWKELFSLGDNSYNDNSDTGDWNYGVDYYPACIIQIEFAINCLQTKLSEFLTVFLNYQLNDIHVTHAFLFYS